MREPGAEGDPLCAAFGQTETVFQWHSDSFALPKGAVHLASSPLCEQQAFRYKDFAWGLQFHPEMTEVMIRAWLRQASNRKLLASLRGSVDPMTIRHQSRQHLARLRELSQQIATAFSGIVANTIKG